VKQLLQNLGIHSSSYSSVCYYSCRLLLYFIIKYILGKDGNFIFGKKNKKLNLNVEELHENIHEINFPESIAKFELAHDYRSAVRISSCLFLKN
jgi:hypothetical protein